MKKSSSTPGVAMPNVSIDFFFFVTHRFVHSLGFLPLQFCISFQVFISVVHALLPKSSRHQWMYADSPRCDVCALTHPQIRVLFAGHTAEADNDVFFFF